MEVFEGCFGGVFGGVWGCFQGGMAAYFWVYRHEQSKSKEWNQSPNFEGTARRCDLDHFDGCYCVGFTIQKRVMIFSLFVLRWKKYTVYSIQFNFGIPPHFSSHTLYILLYIYIFIYIYNKISLSVFLPLRKKNCILYTVYHCKRFRTCYKLYRTLLVWW